MADPVNYFAHRTAAERYGRGRPNVHPAVVARIVQLTRTTRFLSALDVGCGTGQSTRAVQAIADCVIGVDRSAEMLAQTTPHLGVHYQRASAESLPFADSSFDLLTVGLAFHWFDQRQFLSEARRVLRDDGWLAVYNSGFLGEIAEESRFANWYREVYLSCYPNPSRGRGTVSPECVAPFRFALSATESLGHAFPMSRNQCLDYLLTQSNVISAVEQGSESLESVEAFLRDGLSAFFPEEPRTLRFQSVLELLRAI